MTPNNALDRRGFLQAVFVGGPAAVVAGCSGKQSASPKPIKRFDPQRSFGPIAEVVKLATYVRDHPHEKWESDIVQGMNAVNVSERSIYGQVWHYNLTVEVDGCLTKLGYSEGISKPLGEAAPGKRRLLSDGIVGSADSLSIRVEKEGDPFAVHYKDRGLDGIRLKPMGIDSASFPGFYRERDYQTRKQMVAVHQGYMDLVTKINEHLGI